MKDKEEPPRYIAATKLFVADIFMRRIALQISYPSARTNDKRDARNRREKAVETLEDKRERKVLGRSPSSGAD
jgi:hypothetical protein